VPGALMWCSQLHDRRRAPWRPVPRAYSESMRIAIGVIGVIVALFGLLWALQGFGVVGGSPMSNTITWSIIGPIVALIGVALVVGAVRRKS
jgi:amino acid transporter